MSLSSYPCFAVRSSYGVEVKNGNADYESNAEFKHGNVKGCRIMVFSSDGRYFAWAIAGKINIVQTSDWTLVGEIAQPRCAEIVFSPMSTFLMTWQPFIINKEQPNGAPNLHVYKTDNWELYKTFTHKKQMNWQLQWTDDETVCGHMINDDVVFYENNNFDCVVHRINFAKIRGFSVAPGVAPFHVLCYTAGVAGQPGLSRLFQYPKFEIQQSVANKTFFQADKVEFHWNAKGTNALLVSSTEVDKTGASYYGKTTLHYMATDGNSAMVTLNKEGPVYTVAWSPKNTEFCVVYGFIPTKATVFNFKCEPIFDMGGGHRNSIYYNPQGNIILLGGFGNLRGQVELWDRHNKKQISKCDAPDTTILKWSPDGIHFLTATTAPRLRIGNGYKIWHYSGTLLHERSYGQEEVYDVQWQTYPAGFFKAPLIKNERIEGIAINQPQASKLAYRPPSARGKQVFTTTLQDEQPTGQPEKGASKAALKQKKKREAKKAKKQENVDGDAQVQDTVEKEKLSSGITVILTGDVEKDKKIKNLKKKLDAIIKLKEQQAEGKPLEINQLAKIKGEEDLLKELKTLQI